MAKRVDVTIGLTNKMAAGAKSVARTMRNLKRSIGRSMRGMGLSFRRVAALCCLHARFASLNSLRRLLPDENTPKPVWVRNPYNIKIVLETVDLPIIVDAGVGTASDAAEAMELGCDAVLINTAIAGAKDPIMMAEAMKIAQAICDNGKSAVRLVKEVAMLGIEMPIADALWLEEVYFERNRTQAADEIKERIAKFQQASKKKKT